ncbi:MAG TPA: methionine--tRNA ligase subunit beta, partial [Cyclobacteriaceae bacterium]|nr:methionine--tRNA ligase subunit beta [Cyclobacteriaceae bacterium]
EAKDSEFTWKDYQGKNNNELVAIFGNFVNRALVLAHKYFEGKVPALGALDGLDNKVMEALGAFPSKIGNAIGNYKFREATAHLMDLARLGNKYLADTEPWKLAKTDMGRVGTILNLSLQIAANLAVLSSPFLPFTAEKLKRMLNLGYFTWEKTGEVDLLQVQHALNPAELLFEKIEDEVIAAQVGRLKENKRKMEQQNGPAHPAKPEITFDDFSKMDMRIGTVVSAERVEKSKKLLKMQVDTGIGTRTVLSGIAEHYAPEEMVGKQVTVLVNLAPRKIMGIESQGMILMAEDKDGALKLISTSDKVTPGSSIS